MLTIAATKMIGRHVAFDFIIVGSSSPIILIPIGVAGLVEPGGFAKWRGV